MVRHGLDWSASGGHRGASCRRTSMRDSACPTSGGSSRRSSRPGVIVAQVPCGPRRVFATCLGRPGGPVPRSRRADWIAAMSRRWWGRQNRAHRCPATGCTRWPPDADMPGRCRPGHAGADGVSFRAPLAAATTAGSSVEKVQEVLGCPGTTQGRAWV